MTTETRTINVTAYRDPVGRPTCAVPSEECQFLCADEDGYFCGATGVFLSQLDGYLRPCAGCLVWTEEVPK